MTIVRYVTVDMFRLRSGNDNLCQELHRRLLCDSSVCPNCGENEEILEHFFVHF